MADREHFSAKKYQEKAQIASTILEHEKRRVELYCVENSISISDLIRNSLKETHPELFNDT